MDLGTEFERVRAFSMALATPLAPEDAVVQSMPDASPTKWHLAHTSWFFERFVLAAFSRTYRPYDARYEFLFNSYYESVGERHPRAQRGLLTRPTLGDVLSYRSHVDRHVRELVETMRSADRDALVSVLLLGIHHEQQHQELLLTDIKHAFFANPLRPAYRKNESTAARDDVSASPLSWASFPESLAFVGHDGNGFAFDNESPRHRVFLHAFELARRPVTNGEFVAFIQDGGYARPDLWLSDGWACRKARNWEAPLYWERIDDASEGRRPHDVSATSTWMRMTLSGMRRLDFAAPVSHVSFYEADVYARWAGARLPTEHEWERVAEQAPHQGGNFVESGPLDPIPCPCPASDRARADNESVLHGLHGLPEQLFGDVWEWTASPYVAYPGFIPLDGGLGEYNGKFMCNQLVLRGGSCVTSRSHVRATYRNFFPPDARWQFTGLRMARSR